MPAEAEHRFAREAMATTFEIFVWSADREAAARACGEALDLVESLEADLSHYRPTSDIGRINAAPAGLRVKVSPDTFDCLEIAARAWQASAGLFDITVGTLYAAWRDPEDRPREPTQAAIREALQRVGMDKLRLHRDALEVEKTVDRLTLTLGGIGKGFALDKMAAQLRERHELHRFLLNSGQSTLLAGEPPPGRAGWPVGLNGRAVDLARRSLSSSGTARKGGHILDPRSGQPARGRARVWAYADTGAVSDVASTAAMMMSPAECEGFRRVFPDASFVFAETP